VVIKSTIQNYKSGKFVLIIRVERHRRRKSVKLEFLKGARVIELSARLDDGYGTSCRAIDLIQAKERTKQMRARRKA
jgi:hypothetical protein